MENFFKILRVQNSITITNKSDGDIIISLRWSPTCNLDESYEAIFSNSVIEAGGEEVYKLSTADGLYKFIIESPSLEKEEVVYMPQYNVHLTSLIEDIEHILCGCGCVNCPECDGESEDLLTVLLKLMSYNIINRGKYSDLLSRAHECVSCDILTIGNCNLLRENVIGNSTNTKLLRELIAFYYLCFYYVDIQYINDINKVKEMYNYAKIYPCAKRTGVNLKCIENTNWRIGEGGGLEADVEDMKFDITDIQNNITNIEGNINDIEGNITNIEGNITTIEGNIDDIEGNIDDIEGNISDLENELQTVALPSWSFTIIDSHTGKWFKIGTFTKGMVSFTLPLFNGNCILFADYAYGYVLSQSRESPPANLRIGNNGELYVNLNRRETIDVMLTSINKSTSFTPIEPVVGYTLAEIEATTKAAVIEISLKQDKTDEDLQTTDKTIVGAINETVNGISLLHANVNDAMAELEEDLVQAISLETANRTTAISALDDQKQNKTDENLQTTDKTVIGAINEVKTQVDNFGIEHSYTIDFYTTSELSQDMNIAGDISIESIEMRNVTTLYLSYTGVVKKAITAAELPLSIPNNTVLNWEIVRTNDNELACIGISYVKQ